MVGLINGAVIATILGLIAGPGSAMPISAW